MKSSMIDERFRLLVQATKQSNRLWRAEVANDDPSERAKCLRLLKAARQVELLRSFSGNAHLVIDTSCTKELTYGVQLNRPASITNLEGRDETVSDAEHIPHRVLAEWMCVAEIEAHKSSPVGRWTTKEGSE